MTLRGPFISAGPHQYSGPLDHPDVLVFPPFVLIGTIIFGFALQALFPVHVIASIALPIRWSVGIAALSLGVAMIGAGTLTLRRHGTNVNPRMPATIFVQGGIYAWTRNPMYAGGWPLMLGIAFIFAVDWL